MYFRNCFLFFALSIASFSVPASAAVGQRNERDATEFTGGTGWGDSKEEILQNRERRKQKLKGMVDSMRKKLADHSAGEIILSPQEKADTERRLDLFSRKLDMMEVVLEDNDIERIIARSQSQKKLRESWSEEIQQGASHIVKDEL